MSTPYLGIIHIAASQNQKEVTANAAFDTLDAALNAEASFALTDAATALTLATFQMASLVLKLTGTLTANRNVIVPASARLFAILNASTGGHSVTVKTASGTGIAVFAANGYVLLYCDGTNVVAIDAACAGSGSLPTPTEFNLAPGAAGNFSVAHGLGVIPKWVSPPQMTSSGEIYFQSTRYDDTNIYLVASDASVTGKIHAWI